MQTRKNKRNGIFPLFLPCNHEKPPRELNCIYEELFMAVFIPIIRDKKHLLPWAFLGAFACPFGSSFSLGMQRK
jgi:hypothetical protein